MRLLKHLIKRGYRFKTGNCDCLDRYQRFYGDKYSVIVWKHGEFKGDRKKGKRKGLPSEIELYFNGKLLEKFRLHASAREFDDWLKGLSNTYSLGGNKFLEDHVKVNEHG